MDAQSHGRALRARASAREAATYPWGRDRGGQAAGPWAWIQEGSRNTDIRKRRCPGTDGEIWE
eukprot:5165532-Pyramimonas_sp.AAC.1